jgi:alanine dehydrogenase
MRIGVPREIKAQEGRVGLTPASVRTLTERGHEVRLERGAGKGAGLTDDDYTAAGAIIVESPEEVWAESTLIWKVKEPLAEERARLRKDHVLYTYLHLAPDRAQTEALLASGCVAIAYETIEHNGRLPLLTPMSEVAGRLSIQAGARCLESHAGGRGVLLGGVPGVQPGRVVVVGGGVVGANAVAMAVGLGAEVTLLDIDLDTLRRFDELYRGRVRTISSTAASLRSALHTADLVVGAVLVPGARAPHLIRREHLAEMLPGSVIVDVAVDQGGCVQTSRPTTHADPTFVVDGVLHYCVANMPGAVARTSTFALNSATLRYGSLIADHGWEGALERAPELSGGVNVARGAVTHPAVARAHDLPLEAL